MQFAVLPGLAVLNPGGRDPDQDFSGTAFPGPDASGHPPVNYHGYAACTRGGFYQSTLLAGRHRNAVLLLRRNLRGARRAFEALKKCGCFVAIAFKEAGLHQVAAALDRSKTSFVDLAADADLCLASTPDLAAIFQPFSRRVAYVPTPYPINQPAWDFSVAHPAGLFIGTREFDVPSRNHLLALTAARRLPGPITVVARRNKREHALLADLRFPRDQLRVIPSLAYPEYLRELGRHRVVLQFDQSSVPGQVAGDAVLCRVPVVGGNGAIEREVFPDFCGHGHALPELIQIAQDLLRDDAQLAAAKLALVQRAQTRISCEIVAVQLAELFPGLMDC